MYIYCITNNLTGLKYVGKCAKPVEKSKKYFGLGIRITTSIKKYGVENFSKEVLEEDFSNKVLLSDREKFWIKYLNTKTPNGYNLTDGGDGCQGMTEETKEKIRQTNRLKVGEKSSRYGKKNTTEHNRQLREINLGKTLLDETKEKLRKANLGRKKSKESIEKTTRANIGRKYSEETNKKIRENQPHALKVSQLTKNGEFVTNYPSAIEAYRVTGVNNTSIANCCKGRCKSAGGYIWKFSKDIL